MPDWPIWVWVIIAVVVIAIIIGIIIAVTRGGEGAKRQRAEDLRAHAHENDGAIASRTQRADELAARAQAVRNEAQAETERADLLRMQAAEAEESAARAAEAAELRDDEARHSREKLDEMVHERDETLRKADELDPHDEATMQRSTRTDDGGGMGRETVADDVPRDESGRRLDPYGNPVDDDGRAH